MPTAIIRGAKLVYDVAGPESGPPIVLSHSVGLSTREGWRAQVPVLAAAGWRVVTYDTRGLGESEPGDLPLGIATFTEDLAALLDRLGIARAVLMGVSLGGFVSQSFVCAYPERVRALILASTACRIPSGGPQARHAERNVRIRAGGMAVAAEPQVERHFSAEYRAANPEVVAWYLRHYLANDPERYIAIMEDDGRFDRYEEIAAVRCPTLVIAGGEDKSPVSGARPGDSARLIASRIPGARLEIVAGSHHYPQIEHAAQFNALMMDFLAKLPKD